MGSRRRKAARVPVRARGLTAREVVRREGYKSLRKGMPKATVARRLGVAWNTVNEWAKRAKKAGWESWRDEPRIGRPKKLTEEQQEKLLGIFVQNATACGYPTDLWTMKRVAEVIKREFGVTYNVTHVWRVLRDLGLSPQVPQLVAVERNDEYVRWWVENEWPKIVKFARENGAIILFLDESFLQSCPNFKRTWALRGSRPELRVVEGRRDKLSLISAVTAEGELYFNVHEGNIKSPEVMVFLHHLLQEIAGKIVVVWDSGGIHRSVVMKEFLWQNRRRIITKRFPTYSPYLNPDEWVWNLAKEHDLANWCPRDLEEMKRVAKAEMLKLQRQPVRVKQAIRGARIPLPINKRLPDGWRRTVTL